VPEPTPNPTPEPREEVRPDSPALEPELIAAELESTDKKHDPYAALRSKNYQRFALGFVTSSTGLQMLSTGIAWEIYERTGDALALGFTGLARAIPVLILALPAGQAADIFNRKKVLVATQTAFALLTAILAVVSWAQAPVWTIYLLLFLTGCARSFNGPSRSSLLPLIVEPQDFHNAVTWNSGVFQFSATGGPILAGIIIRYAHAAWPVYVCCAASCALFALTASALDPRQEPRETAQASKPDDSSLGSKFTLKSMTAGAGHLWREKTILAAITLDLFAVLLGGATALMPIYAKDILHVGPVGLGALKSAPYIGAFLMALVLAHRPPFRHAGPVLLLSVAAFGIGTIVFGYSTWFPLSLAALVFLGGVDNISVVIRHVLVQVRTPDHLRGRVSAVNSVFIESSNELGAFESGLVAKVFGPVISVVAGGIGTIAVVLGIAWLWPEVRRMGRIDPMADPGTCAKCGYNLRGLRNGNAPVTCPECGTVSASSS
jgi:MFS family permease